MGTVKIIRRIVEGKKVEDEYPRRNNSEIYEIHKDSIIHKIIKARGLQCFGRMERMGERRIPKVITWKIPQYRKGRRSLR